MAKSYIDIEVSDEVVSKTYEALQQARKNGTIKKGSNEVTKSIERGLAKFVVVAGDVDPEEVVMHIPKLCKQRKISYSFVPSKQELGKSIGINVPCTAIAVEKEGDGANAIKDVIAKVTGTSQRKEAAAPAAEQKPAPAKE